MQRWETTHQDNRTHLLRLSILRDLARSLHSWQSIILASGDSKDLPQFNFWQENIEKLVDRKDLSGQLTEILKENPKQFPPHNIQHSLPFGLLSNIDRARLHQPHAKWELAIACHAHRIGWRFWNLLATIPVFKIEKWNQNLHGVLWPNGIVLQISRSKKKLSRLTKMKSKVRHDDNSLWTGRWLIVLDNHIRTPEELISSNLKKTVHHFNFEEIKQKK